VRLAEPGQRHGRLARLLALAERLRLVPAGSVRTAAAAGDVR
ncbi:MAG: hypothetical protein RL227_75, partial [Pseudomonadota bacterium]